MTRLWGSFLFGAVIAGEGPCVQTFRVEIYHGPSGYFPQLYRLESLADFRSFTVDVAEEWSQLRAASGLLAMQGLLKRFSETFAPEQMQPPRWLQNVGLLDGLLHEHFEGESGTESLTSGPRTGQFSAYGRAPRSVTLMEVLESERLPSPQFGAHLSARLIDSYCLDLTHRIEIYQDQQGFLARRYRLEVVSVWHHSGRAAGVWDANIWRLKRGRCRRA